jgi:hypothetical protein
MFDWLDPAGSLANKYLGVPKTGVTTSDDPKNIGEMITNRIPGARGGSMAQDFINMNTGKGETEKERNEKIKALEAEVAAGRKTKEQAQMEATQKANQGMKAGGKVKSASSRADGCAIRGKTRA